MGKSIFLLCLRIFVLIFISVWASKVIVYGNFSPGIGILQDYKLPQLLYSFGNFDGAHYISIARDGYFDYEQAFFPLYPLLIRYLGLFLNKNYLISGLIISNVSFAVSLLFFYKFVRLIDKKNASWIILFLVFFPSAFFFSAVYSESLFFLFFAGALYFLKTKKILWAVVFSYFCALTRLVGFFLIIPILYEILVKSNCLKYFINNFSLRLCSTKPKTGLEKKPICSNWQKSIILFSAPFLGLGTYMIYLYRTTGDFFYFLSSQPAFGANRSSNIILLPQVIYRYIKIFFNSDFNYAYFTAVLEFVFFGFVFVILMFEIVRHWKKKNYYMLSLGLFSLANIILPTLTGTLSSVPRYSLMSISVYFFLAGLCYKIKISVLCFFAAVQILLLSLFLQGYFVG